MNNTVVIIGAGIAGLSCAIAFEKLGFEVVLFESASEIKAAGAGLGIAGNAIGAFRVLGIDDVVMNCGKKLEQFPILDQKGNCIYSASSDRIARKFGVENFTIHRADLHNVLLRQLKSTKIITGKKLKGIKQTENYCLVFEDGTKYNAEYIIGADGIHSKVRNFINPKSTIRFAGYDCWRGVVENTFNIVNGSETWGENGRFGIVPLANNKLYWFLCRNRKTKESFKLSKGELISLFTNYHEPIPKIITATPEDEILFNPILDLKPQKVFTKDNILLIGDAAHATTPNLGQGACQAVEDVATLYQLILKTENLKAAFQKFAEKRLKRTHYIVKTSWNIGRVAQLENPFGVWIRNFLFKITPSRINNKQLEKIIYNIDYEL